MSKVGGRRLLVKRIWPMFTWGKKYRGNSWQEHKKAHSQTMPNRYKKDRSCGQAANVVSARWPRQQRRSWRLGKSQSDIIYPSPSIHMRTALKSIWKWLKMRPKTLKCTEKVKPPNIPNDPKHECIYDHGKIRTHQARTETEKMGPRIRWRAKK